MSRRLAREVAFRSLFQIDIGKCSAKHAVKRNLEDFSLSETEERFINELVDGTLEKISELDALIRKHLVKWDLDRISAVDRNLLRLGLYEILERPDIPYAVSINEALELAKKYGSTGEAVGFINGILDRAVGDIIGKE